MPAEPGKLCPYCQAPVTGTGTARALVRCKRCQSVHHADCWDENQGCAVVGCGGTEAEAVAAGPPPPPPPPPTPDPPRPPLAPQHSTPPPPDDLGFQKGEPAGKETAATSSEPGGSGKTIAIVGGLFLLVVALAVGGFLLIGGGDDASKSENSAAVTDEEVTADDLAEVMDEVCSNSEPGLDALGVDALSNPGFEAEALGYAEIYQAIADDLGELNATVRAQSQLDDYIDAVDDIVRQQEANAEFAAADDDQALEEGWAELTERYEAHDEIADEIGSEACGRISDREVVATDTSPPDDLEFGEPENTVDEAAESFVEAAESGDCDAFSQTWHSDQGEVPAAECDEWATNMKGTTVAGTEQYGPVGLAQLVQGNGTQMSTIFATDLDGTLRYGGHAFRYGGGLRPAPEDNDAQESIEGTIAAIRDNDGAAFNELLQDETSDHYLDSEGEFDDFGNGDLDAELIDDVRASDDEPVQLGLNASFGFSFLPGSTYDWVLITQHTPGLGSDYRFTGYLPVPKP